MVPSQPYPVRLLPGDDLRRALEDYVAAHGLTAAFVLAGWDFSREPDARTGWSELVIRRAS